MKPQLTTQEEFKTVITNCRELFVKKMHDYGTAWRIMRPNSVTDQIYIKANRIRAIETTGENLVGEDIAGDFIGIVNYAIMGLIQLQEGASEAFCHNANDEDVLALYDKHAEAALQLMLRKNHDYGEAWRNMRVSSYTDLILMKILRTKQIEDLKGNTLVSEGIAANYMDMMNYAVFGLIKLTIEA